jgi:hypothetical protein
MRAALRLEDIKSKDAHWVNAACRALGERSCAPTRAWVARVRINANGYVDREFLRPCAMDYSQANSVGSRGVYKCYWLEPMAYYEVSSPESWSSTDRYFCEVVDGEIIRMTKEEVQDAQARPGS